MSPVAQIRVFLVDDHEIVRRGVASLIEPTADIVVVGGAATAARALPEILRLSPDVVVTDAHLSDGSGVDLCRAVTEQDPTIHGLILTTDDDPHAISTAILGGVAGYVMKRIDGASLVSGIRLVAGGSSLIDPSMATRVLEYLEAHRRSVAAFEDLTPQQRRIFLLIADGLSNREIAEQLGLAEKTVKNHVTSILARLGLRQRTQAALLATSAGISR